MSDDERERSLLVAEIAKTEQVYVRTLTVLNEVFNDRLKENHILTEDVRKRIFPSSVATFSQVHGMFLGKLNDRVACWDKESCIGDLFVELCPFLALVTPYVTEYGMQMKAFNDAKASNPTFRTFIESCFVELKDPSNGMSSLLIQPVQRLPRYLLFLKSLLKHTPSTHPDRKLLEQAESQVASICQKIDKKAEDSENVGQLYRIQESLVGEFESLVHPFRRFISEETVFVMHKHRDPDEERMFVFNDAIVFANVVRQEGKKQPVYHFSSKWTLNDCELEVAQNHKQHFCFHLHDRKASSSLCLGFNTADARDAAFKNLETRIKDLRARESTLRRNLQQQQQKDDDRKSNDSKSNILGPISKIFHRRNKSNPDVETPPVAEPLSSPRSARTSESASSAANFAVPSAISTAIATTTTVPPPSSSSSSSAPPSSFPPPGPVFVPPADLHPVLGSISSAPSLIAPVPTGPRPTQPRGHRRTKSALTDSKSDLGLPENPLAPENPIASSPGAAPKKTGSKGGKTKAKSSSSKQIFVKAIACETYKPEDDCSGLLLSFNQGDELTIVDTSNPSGWFYGYVQGRHHHGGLIPGNKVKLAFQESFLDVQPVDVSKSTLQLPK